MSVDTQEHSMIEEIMTENNIKPRIPVHGTVFQHAKKGTFYRVDGVCNRVDTEDFPLTVVYTEMVTQNMDPNRFNEHREPKTFSRPLVEFLDKFVPYPYELD